MPTIAILSHAFEGSTAKGCDVCTLAFSHPVHSHGSEGAEVSVRAEAPTPRVAELCDAYGMLQQAAADLAGRRNGVALQTLRDALAVLRAELGPHIAVVPSPTRAHGISRRGRHTEGCIDARCEGECKPD
jgi:hypothetical protein